MCSLHVGLCYTALDRIHATFPHAARIGDWSMDGALSLLCCLSVSIQCLGDRLKSPRSRTQSQLGFIAV